MDGSRWDERCLYYLGLVVCSSWWIQHLAVLKILWCMLPRLVPRLKVWSVVVWVIKLLMLNKWGHLYALYRFRGEACAGYLPGSNKVKVFGERSWFLLVEFVLEWWLLVVALSKSVREESTQKEESGVGSSSRSLMVKELPGNQNGLPPMIYAMLIASAKSRCVRGASHQPPYMASCLTISHSCFPCLRSGRTLF